jgi:hypothetical protein
MNKEELMGGLKQEYQDWQSLLDQIGVECMEQPGIAGAWSIKDIVAHLTGWRRRTVGRLRAVQLGQPEPLPPWPAELETDDAINEWIYESNRAKSAGRILDESDAVFQQLLAVFEELPEEVLSDPGRFPWMEGRPLRAADFFAHFHDEHEPDMRAWLARSAG